MIRRSLIPSWKLWWVKPLALVFSYGVFFSVFKLLVVTLTTYLLVSSSSQAPRFEDINEALISNQVITMALAVTAFIWIRVAFQPITKTKVKDFFKPAFIEKHFLFGFQGGALLGTAIVLAFVLNGTYLFLGVLIRLNDAPLAAVGIGLRALALAVFVYFEEFIFRQNILPLLRKPNSGFMGDVFSIVATSVLYCLIKVLQFDLGIMHVITLFIVSCTLSLRTLSEGNFASGAGFWSAILIIFHPILSLPIFGNDYSGLFLVKYQTILGQHPAFIDQSSRFLTGGLGGPLSSFAFQVLLLIDILRGLLQYQKNLLRRIHPQIN